MCSYSFVTATGAAGHTHMAVLRQRHMVVETLLIYSNEATTAAAETHWLRRGHRGGHRGGQKLASLPAASECVWGAVK